MSPAEAVERAVLTALHTHNIAVTRVTLADIQEFADRITSRTSREDSDFDAHDFEGFQDDDNGEPKAKAN